MRKPRIRLIRCGKTIRRFEEVLRSVMLFAFGNMIQEKKKKTTKKFIYHEDHEVTRRFVNLFYYLSLWFFVSFVVNKSRLIPFFKEKDKLIYHEVHEVTRRL